MRLEIGRHNPVVEISPLDPLHPAERTIVEHDPRDRRTDLRCRAELVD
jgi:hypothetical protein